MTICPHGISGRCAACSFQHSRHAIEKRFKIPGTGVTWIEVQWKPTFAIGCLVCRAFQPACKGKQSPWQNLGVSSYDGVQIGRVAQHAQSAPHIAAVKALGDEDQQCTAPSASDFKKVLNHARKNPLGREGVTEVAGHKKSRKVLWCLAEGHRELKRALWRHPSCVVSTTLFQDARKATSQRDTPLPRPALKDAQATLAA